MSTFRRRGPHAATHTDRHAAAHTGIATGDRFDQVSAAVGDVPPAALAHHVDRLDLAPGTVVTRRGTAAREAVVVLDGELVGDDPTGRESVGAGSIVGAAEVLEGAAHQTTFVARTPVALLVVEGRALRAAAHESAAFGARLRLLATAS